jgi:NADH-quinone oxidoreductase subunit N
MADSMVPLKKLLINMNAILALSIFGILSLFLGFLKNRTLVYSAAIIFTLIALLLNTLDWNHEYIWFGQMLSTNNLSINFTNIILIGGLLVIGLSRHFGNDTEHSHPAEYYALMLFAMVGAIMLCTFDNLIMLFVGLEILSVAMYILTGSDKRNPRSNEAALKYFLMGAFATGILLFGIALIYGSTGTFHIQGIGSEIAQNANYMGSSLYVGIVMLLVGLLFKVSVAPFHFWTADVYDGAPTIFTAFMSTIVKTAGFAALMRITLQSFEHNYRFWWAFFMILTILTLLISNISAVNQKSFKRMMAYSSISHAGYLMIALLSKTEQSASAILFYSLSYTLATVVAFGVFMLVSEHHSQAKGNHENVDIFDGLAKANPLLAFCLAVSMFSLSGIPLTAGFWGKFFVFGTAVSRNIIWLLIYAVLMSAVGIYYYFKPVIASYFKNGISNSIKIPLLYQIVLILATCILLLLGVYPDFVKNIY